MALNVDQQDDKQGLLGRIATKGIQQGLRALIPDPDDSTPDEPVEPRARLSRFASRVLEDEHTRDLVVGYAAEQIRDEVVAFGTRLRQNTTEVLSSMAERFDPDQMNSYELIRNRIAPKGGLLRTIAARLLWVGAKVGTFVSAILIDQFSGRGEAQSNRPHIERILAGLIGKRTIIAETDSARRQTAIQAREDQRNQANDRIAGAVLPTAWQGI